MPADSTVTDERVREELTGVDPERYPQEVLIIGAATLPVSTLRACLMARLLGARVRLKPASGLDGLAHAIAATDDAITADCFSSTDPESLERALGSVDTIVALGSIDGDYKLCVQAKPKLQTLFNPDSVTTKQESAMPPPVDISANEASSADPLGNLTGGAPGLGGVSSPGLDAAMLGAGAAGGSGPTPLPGMPGGQEIHFAPGIEEEANSHFQKIYSGATSIADVTTMLRTFQASSVAR
uniref:hypothetical protein n=1 Tax=Thioclava electrotropha TaxID=1549850 RepID=UPI0023A8779F